jgi:pimeloyl-ACP methyl ester carboxylesterase
MRAGPPSQRSPSLIVLLGLALSFFFSSTLIAQLPDSRIRRTDPSHIEVVIPAVDGTIQWQDVATAVADELKLDPRSVQQLMPHGKLDLRSDTVLLALMGINLAADDAISFSLIRDDQNRSSLRVRCNRTMLGKLKRRQQTRGAEISLDDDWRERSKDLPLVICIHGLQSQSDVFDEFRQHLRSKGYATAAVSYNPDQSIADSAAQSSLFAKQLFAFSETEPRLALVGHSMGGLVAREWTENEALSDQRIAALITIGTPHGGSNWASLPPLLDLFTAGDFDASDLVDVILHQPSALGLRDLIPGSEFLQRMAARPSRKDVAYTCIVGTGSPVSDDQATQLRDALRRLDRDGSVVRLIRPRIRPLLESFDELAGGKGDGVVAADRATIKGQDDVVRIDLSHFEMIRPIDGRSDHPIWHIVTERLEALKTE